MSNKFSVNYEDLQKKFNAKKSYKLEDVKYKIKKVAFDVVRFLETEDIDGLWQVQHRDDGDYIVAMYDEPIKTASAWSVVSDRNQKNINFFYKDTPIVRLASTKLGIPQEQVSFAIKHLPEKLASNQKLVEGLLLEISPEERTQLLTQFPELNK